MREIRGPTCAECGKSIHDLGFFCGPECAMKACAERDPKKFEDINLTRLAYMAWLSTPAEMRD